MDQPTPGLLPQVQFVTISETPIYLKEPIKTDSGEISSLTIKSDRGRGTEGIDNAVLLVRQKSRRRGEDEYLNPLENVNDYEQIDWNKVGGFTYKDKLGQKVILTKDKLSLEPPHVSETLLIRRSHEKGISTIDAYINSLQVQLRIQP